RLQDEMLLGAGLEIQGAAQGDHQLADRRGVPVERAAGRRLLERDVRGRHLAAQKVAMDAGLKRDKSLLEARLLVVAGPDANAADHGASIAGFRAPVAFVSVNP